MSFSSGTFSLFTPGNPVVTGTTISSTWANNTLTDIASGLSTCVLKDGSQTITANIPMSSFKITGLGVPTTNGDALSYGSAGSTTTTLNATTSIVTPLISGSTSISGVLTGTGNNGPVAPSATTLQLFSTTNIGAILRGNGSVSDTALQNNAGLNALSIPTGTVNATLAGTLDMSAAASGQIAFPSTQNPSAGAHTLDDYSEGTWTPSVGGTATYTTQTGDYTKIGNLVFINMLLQINAIGSGSTTVISGLPFASATNRNTFACQWATSATAVINMTATTQTGSSSIVLLSATAATASLTAANVIFQNATIVQLGGCYRV